jgi:hypothetical protein
MLGNSGVAERVAASQEELSSVELGNDFFNIVTFQSLHDE